MHQTCVASEPQILIRDRCPLAGQEGCTSPRAFSISYKPCIWQCGPYYTIHTCIILATPLVESTYSLLCTPPPPPPPPLTHNLAAGLMSHTFPGQFSLETQKPSVYPMIGTATTLGQINGCMDTKEHVLKGEFIKLQGLWTLHN